MQRSLLPIVVFMTLIVCSCRKDGALLPAPDAIAQRDYISITDSAFGADTSNANNKAQIQAALDQGGSIYFPPGTYKVSGTLILSSNSTLFGPGTIKLDTTYNVPLLQAAHKTNIKIEQLTLDGNAGAITAGRVDTFGLVDVRYTTNMTLDNMLITNAYDLGVQSDHATGLTITDCDITDFNRRGINSVYSYDSKFTGNTIDGKVNHAQKGIHGIEFWGENPSWHDSRNQVVTGNIVRNVSQGGIWANQVDYATFSDNLVTSCGDVGIDMEACNYITITGNQLRNCTNGGITTFYGCKNITISGNQVRQDSTYGPAIYMHGPGAATSVNITGNDLYTRFSAGIYCDQAMISNSVIASNTIVSDGKPGIRLLAANKMSITDNKVTVGVANSMPVIMGIGIEGGSECLLNGNTITCLYDTATFKPGSVDRGGIHLYWVSATYNCQKNTVTNNIIRGFVASVNDNCWGDVASYNYVANNRVSSLYRRSNAAWQGKMENNYSVDNPNTLITPTPY